MKRVSPGIAAPALFLFALPALVRCIPNPDTSGLPPYDAGVFSEDAGSFATADSGGFDATLPPVDGGSDAGVLDGALALGNVSGIVIDYTQGNGQGVVPGAVVTVSLASGAAIPLSADGGTTLTTDANGLFSVFGVPAGVPLQIGVSKPTDLINGIAYSTTYVAVTAVANATVNIFPVLHEGCFQTYVLNPMGEDAGNLPVTLENATCPTGVGSPPAQGQNPRPAAYAAMTFEAESFKDPTTNSLWGGSIRVEMIPLAYPVNDSNSPDLSWALGLPVAPITGNSAGSPPGLLGAAEYRVVKSDPGQPDDGEILALNDPTSDPVSIAVPIYAGPSSLPDGGTAPVLASSYNASTLAWVTESVTPSAVQEEESGGAPAVQYVTIQVPHLTWWAATNGVTTPTSCVTGTLQADSNPVANAFVRASGVTYLGASTALTNGAGSFCLEVPAASEDGGALNVQLFAEALASGVPSSATPLYSVPAGSAGSCATPSGCTNLGAAITLTPSVTCVSGNVLYDDGGAATLTLDSVLVDIPNVEYAQSVGIQSTAYLGQVTPGTGGAFCAIAPPGEIELVQPGDPYCWAPEDDTLSVLSGTSGTVCGAGGCTDAGSLQFGCVPPPPPPPPP